MRQNLSRCGITVFIGSRGWNVIFLWVETLQGPGAKGFIQNYALDLFPLQKKLFRNRHVLIEKIASEQKKTLLLNPYLFVYLRGV